MVKRPRTGFLIAALIAATAGGYLFWQGDEEPSLAVGPQPRGAKPEQTVLPRIALERLERQADGSESAPSRDIFQFGRAQAFAAPVQPSTAPRVPSSTPPDVAPPPPSSIALAPFAVRYVGTVERQGLKVAVLLSEDKKEILTGREGDTVANRLRILRIGLESVEVQDLGSERVRRIPLRGN